MTKNLGTLLTVGTSLLSTVVGGVVVSVVENVKEQVVVNDVYEVREGETVYRYIDAEGNITIISLEDFEAYKSLDTYQEPEESPSQD